MKKFKPTSQSELKKRLFYLSIVIIPILQVCVFYIYVNISFFVNAFTKYESNTGEYVWNGLNNFKSVIQSFQTNQGYIRSIGNSAIMTIVGLSTMFLTLLLAYYLQQKYLGSKFFIIALFLPVIISSMALTMIWQNMLIWVFPALGLPDYFNNVNTAFSSMLVYGIWGGLGGTIFIYISAMNNISPETLESGRLDGLKFFGEFIYLVIPGIFKSISVYILTTLMGFFTSQSAYNFYADAAPAETYTVGYIVFISSLRAKSRTDFPYACAFGLFTTLFAVPTMLISRKLMDKFGPSED